MKPLLQGLAILLVVALAAIAWISHRANKDFTPWMTGAELQKFCDDHDTNPPGGHPNFWDQGHWIDAVEGRWHDGIPEYRVRYSASPKGKGGYLWWYWYFNQDQQSFSSHVHELADQGFTLLDPNSFVRPDDTRRYQGVWHKIQTKAEHDAEKARAQVRSTSADLVSARSASADQPAAPVPPVVDQGVTLLFASVDRAQLGHLCSVFLKPGATSFPQATNLPEGMIVNRGGITIVTGTRISISERMLVIMNQRRGYPVMDQQIDHVTVEP
jgi:hypothetical protein